MISATINLIARQAVTLHNAIEGYKSDKLTSGDRNCLAGVVRRLRKLGNWNAETGVFGAIDSKESPHVNGSNEPVYSPDGTRATVHTYSPTALLAPFPDFSLSPEERGAIFRLLLSIADQPPATPGDWLQALEIGSWLGFDDRMDSIVRKASKVAPYLDEIDD